MESFTIFQGGALYCSTEKPQEHRCSAYGLQIKTRGVERPDDSDDVRQCKAVPARLVQGSRFKQHDEKSSMIHMRLLSYFLLGWGTVDGRHRKLSAVGHPGRRSCIPARC